MSVTVAYLGPQGTFTEAAVWAFARRGCFGVDEQEVELLACSSPKEAIDAVRISNAAFACVAIENSVDGSVTPTFDALASGDAVQIYHEHDLSIAFAMMVPSGTSLADVRTVATHPVAYQQVKGWLAKHVPHHEFIAASSNAAAAQMVAEGKADMAAAPERAAALFGLEVVEDRVADVAGARTRFVVVGKPGVPTPATGCDRTALMFTLHNEPGALVRALNEFALRGVDLSRIESRPIEDGLGTYRFYVHLNGHVAEDTVAEALRALHQRSEIISFLGSWPVASASERERLLAEGRDTQSFTNASAWVEAIRTGQDK